MRQEPICGLCDREDALHEAVAHHRAGGAVLARAARRVALPVYVPALWAMNVYVTVTEPPGGALGMVMFRPNLVTVNVWAMVSLLT